MTRWPKCCFPGCTERSMAVYRRRQRGPEGVLQSTRTRGLCGKHDHLLRTYWDRIWALLEVDQGAAQPAVQDALLLIDAEAWVQAVLQEAAP